MAEQIQKSKQGQTKEADQELSVETPTTDSAETLQGIDDLLDEIDEVLEQNAEEFVKGYVQKGGQ